VTDLDRVLALPISEPTEAEAKALIVELSEQFRRPLAERKGLDRPLRAEQAVALADLAAAPAPRGTVPALQVGGGKTLVGMLAPRALTPRPQRPLALVPASLVRQWGRMHADWSRDYVLSDLQSYPAISHDELSRPDSTDLLDRRAPDCIVIDEAHAFRHADAARTRRLLRYVVRNPSTRVVIMTGSLAAETLRDYAHLLELALREGAPVPLSDPVLAQWCAALDYRGAPEWSDWTAIWPMVRAFCATDPGPLNLTVAERTGPTGFERFGDPSKRIRPADRERHARAGYGRRLRTTPGITISKGSICRAGLRIRLWRPTPPAAITEALHRLTGGWVLPDGTELVDALEIHRHARTLARGYFNRWRWPDCDLCRGTGENQPPRGPELTCFDCEGRGRTIDHEWLEARRGWNAAVRNALEYGAREGFDSPALVERACRDGRAGGALMAAYARWQTVAHHPEPPTEIVWLDGARAWLTAAIRTWLHHVAPHEHEGDDTGDTAAGPPPPRGLLWYETRGVESVLYGLGLDVRGAGSDQPRSGSCPALSRRVHGEGANLQAWWANLVLEPMSSGQINEQLIGRTHRPGQTAPLVRIDVFAPTWVGRRALEEAIARTEFLRHAGGLGDFAKLLIADYEPPIQQEVTL